MKNELLDNIEHDLKLLLDGKFHKRDQDLINMFFREDLVELIAFARKVNSVFEKPLPDGTGEQYRGFKICFEILKREIYETK